MLFYFLIKKCKIIDIHYNRLTMFHISNYHNQLWVLSLVVGVSYLKVSGRPGGSGHDTESPTSSLVLYDELADVNPSHQTMTHIQDLWHCQQREKMCSCILVYYKIFWVIGVNSTSVCLNSLWEIFNWCANKIHIFFFINPSRDLARIHIIAFISFGEGISPNIKSSQISTKINLVYHSNCCSSY